MVHTCFLTYSPAREDSKVPTVEVFSEFLISRVLDAGGECAVVYALTKSGRPHLHALVRCKYRGDYLRSSALKKFSINPVEYPNLLQAAQTRSWDACRMYLVQNLTDTGGRLLQDAFDVGKLFEDYTEKKSSSVGGPLRYISKVQLIQRLVERVDDCCNEYNEQMFNRDLARLLYEGFDVVKQQSVLHCVFKSVQAQVEYEHAMTSGYPTFYVAPRDS